MENLCKGLLFGMAVGVVIGGIAVAKNKNLENKVKQGLTQAEEKLEEAKDMIVTKLQESGNSSNSENGTGAGACQCEQGMDSASKKSKK